jgi:hypothetical protein
MRRQSLLLIALASCGHSSPPNATVQVTWDFLVDGSVTNVCGDVSMIQLDIDGTIDTVACDAPIQSVDVGPGQTTIQLTATDSDGYSLGVWSVSQDLGPGDLATVNADIDLGDTMAATWSITQGGTSATCAAVGAKYVQIVTVVPDAANDMFVDVFDCTDLAGTTAPFQLGTTYTVHAELLDSANRPLATTTPGPIPVTTDGQITLAPFTFSL